MATRTRGGALRAPATAALAALLVALLVGLLAGCGLRFETPPPVPLTPDAGEVARQGASADALALEVLAAAPGADPADPVAGVRGLVVAHAKEHLDALGGIYVSGLESPEPAAEATPSPAAASTPPAEAATTDAVVAQLVLAAASARGGAESVPDGPLARLLASVSTERLLLARQLAGAAGTTPPELPAVGAAAAAPAGVSPSGLSALVAAEDEAGFGYEVIAAKQADTTRANALARAAVHRSRAQAWAAVAGIAATGLDPRRTSYALPAGLDDLAASSALAQSMEQSLAAQYAALVAAADPGARGPLIDALAEAAAQASAWGASIPAFPGLPETA